MISLDSDQLDAFFEVSRSGSFSKAALALAISQPALSQRIRKLEDRLGTALFVRSGHRAELTETGYRLLALCRSRREQEADFMSAFHAGGADRLSGIVRIGAYSSIARSIVMPAVARLIEQNPGVRLELLVRELYELPEMLRKVQADSVFTEDPIVQAGVVSMKVGEEEYVLAEPAKKRLINPDVYFDHDVSDRTTVSFWRIQAGTPKRFARAFAGDIYAVIDAVERGWGRAVLPRHLVSRHPRLRAREDLRSMRVPIHVNYFEQPYYLPLQRELLKLLSRLPT